MIKINVVPEQIGPFVRHHGEASTMEYGFYYEAKMDVPFDKEPRYVRVWLPGTYDFSKPKRYPVLYMADGQNLVDKELTRFGDWHLDRVMYRLMKEGVGEAILVGIDCPKDDLQRMNELNPPFPVRLLYRKKGPNRPIGDQLITYIVADLKPIIDVFFATNSSKEATGIGGSSMGGIFAFFAGIAYPETFGYSHSFSPPFFFYSKRKLRWFMQMYDPTPETHGRFFLYVGGKGFERRFKRKTFYMRKLMERQGYGSGTMGFAYDPKAIHHEEDWSTHSYEALKFWLSAIPERQ